MLPDAFTASRIACEQVALNQHLSSVKICKHRYVLLYVEVYMCMNTGVYVSLDVGNHGVGNHGVGNHGVGNHGVGNHDVGNHDVGNHDVGNHDVGNMMLVSDL
jgi:hypothetical protein